jgi:hypothetical protein
MIEDPDANVIGEASLDPKKILDPEAIRINLMLSSLYLTGFEILKATLIEGVAGVIVYLPERDDASTLELRAIMPEEEYESLFGATDALYRGLIDEYEQKLGIRYHERHRLGLIPSCRWLHEEAGILSEEDIQDVRAIRSHRNAVAHELPSLLLTRAFAVNTDYLEQMMSLVAKVAPFFGRLDAEIPTDVADEDILSGAQIVMRVIGDAVVEDLEQVAG